MQQYINFKEKLEEKLVIIQKELEAIATFDQVSNNWEAITEQEEGGSNADQNTNADSAEYLEERTATVTALEREFNDIIRALKKIKEGTYGFCEISGEPIEEKRLMYVPEARTCMAHMDEESLLPL